MRGRVHSSAGLFKDTSRSLKYSVILFGRCGYSGFLPAPSRTGKYRAKLTSRPHRFRSGRLIDDDAIFSARKNQNKNLTTPLLLDGASKSALLLVLLF